MSDLTPLPRIMVAPNGARRGKADHPAIPITQDELVAAALACQSEGADGLHLHIRDGAGRHVLDPGQYRALLDAMEDAVPDMYLQVTSEAAGRYGAAEQQRIMQQLCPRYVSVGMREMVRSPEDWPAATAFYEWAISNDVEVQHILYSPQELTTFLAAAAEGRIPGPDFLLQFVLGTYDGTQISRPENVQGFVDLLNAAPAPMTFDWGLCAFGKEETACLAQTIALGGKARIGFENSLWNSDGSLAPDNAARVRALQGAIAPDA